jgi:hypothetical protein
MDLFLWVLSVTSCLLLPLSVYPGLLTDVAFYGLVSSPFWLPAACISLWVYLDTVDQVPDFAGARPSRWLRFVAVACLVLNSCLLWYSVPRRFGFLQARRAFDALVATAPRAGAVPVALDRRAGLYLVRQCAADFRGGIYFATHSGPCGFQSGKMTHGFSYRPNPGGSPFGNESYALSHMIGDWYVFQAWER